MSIFSLKVKGNLALKDALGVDETALDLSGIKGLVSFAGKNGHVPSHMGKTYRAYSYKTRSNPSYQWH